ncbi:PA3371 family protein [Pseudomonas sp. MGal98]|uniref:PA3371 family protein n=1 Tax=Pseudomonas sp. MGal98 TaxID=3162460 RepID=UPI0032EC6560
MMSKAAVLFLLIAFVSGGLLAVPGQAQWLMAAAKVTLAVSGVSLAVALLIGKRVKFDPVLR